MANAPKTEAPFDRFFMIRVNEALQAIFHNKARRAGFRSASEWARQTLLASEARDRSAA